MGPDLVLVPGILVDMRRDQNRIALLAGRQRDRALDPGARAARGFNDLNRGLVDEAMIECLETDTYTLIGYWIYSMPVEFDAGLFDAGLIR